MRITSILGISLIAVTAASACAGQPPEPELGYVSFPDGGPTTFVDSIDIWGRDGSGARIGFMVTRDASKNVTVRALRGSVELGTVRLLSERYRDMDLSTARLGFAEAREFLQLAISYGETRRCFYNYDGRDRVLVQITIGSPPNVYVDSFENCDTAR